MSKIPAYSYIRFSSEKQSEGSSLERQESLLNNFLNGNPQYELVSASYKDLGISGFTGAHQNAGALGQFLKACEENRVQAGSFLLVESIDRLGRLSGVNFLSLIIDLFKYVSVITLEDGQVYNNKTFDGSAAFSLQAKIQQAHNYSKQLSTRLRIARAKTKEKVRSGEVKKVTKICPSWLEWDEGRDEFVTLPERVDIVKKIFNMYISDGLGTTAIASRLNESGVLGFNGKGWHGSYISKILFERKVLGEMKGRGEEVFEGYYPQIIDIETFLEAQRQKSVRSKVFRTGNIKNPQPYNIYEGLVFCCCGTEAKLHNKGNGSLIYQCKNRPRGLCKESDGVNIKDLVLHLNSYLHEVLISRLRAGGESVEPIHKNKKTSDLSPRLSILKGRISNCHELLIDVIDDEERLELKKRLAGLREEQADLRLKIKQQDEDKRSNLLSNQFELYDFYKNLIDWLSFFKGDPKRRLEMSRAININRYLKSNAKRINVIMHSKYTVKVQDSVGTVITIKKPYRSSGSSFSMLCNGKNFLEVSNYDFKNSADYEPIQLSKYEDGQLKKIDKLTYFEAPPR